MSQGLCRPWVESWMKLSMIWANLGVTGKVSALTEGQNSCGWDQNMHLYQQIYVFYIEIDR